MLKDVIVSPEGAGALEEIMVTFAPLFLFADDETHALIARAREGDLQALVDVCDRMVGVIIHVPSGCKAAWVSQEPIISQMEQQQTSEGVTEGEAVAAAPEAHDPILWVPDQTSPETQKSGVALRAASPEDCPRMWMTAGA